MRSKKSTSAKGATSGFGKVWIFNRKAASRRRIDEVNFRTLEVRIKFPLRSEHHVVEMIFCIDGGIESSIEIEGVLHPTTSTAQNTDPQKRIGFKVLCLLDAFYFVDCRRSY